MLQKSKRVFSSVHTSTGCSETVDCILSGNKKGAWNGFRLVATNFLGNKKTENYKELVKTLLLSCQTLGCNRPVSMQFLHSYVDVLS